MTSDEPAAVLTADVPGGGPGDREAWRLSLMTVGHDALR